MKRIFEIPWVLFEQSVNLYFDRPKSWIWGTLEKVMDIFCIWHFHNASKEVFWPKKISNFTHGFKSAILAIFPFSQNGSFEIQKLFWPKGFFWGIMKVPYTKNIHNLFSRVCQIQDLGQSKCKLRLFSKRTHGISKILFI